MCGITGTIGIQLSQNEFEKELHKMKHRGPDGYGIWNSEDKDVWMGHRRLAILDKDQRSNQPMVFNERYVIVYNGEIYNYLELRKELQQEGINFITASDTEVLLHMMILKGPSALNRLNGMWAFALYDIIEKTLFISRDRLGKKPMYIVQRDNIFAFASEMKSLYHLFNGISYNEEFIKYSVHNFMDAESRRETIIDGIEKFPSGSYGIYQNGKLKIDRYYFPERLLENNRKFNRFEDAVDEFKALFESSCSLRMRSDVPVGSALSGGIDSSFVVSTIAKLGFTSNGYKALVSGFPGSFLDETKEAYIVAQNAGVPIETIEVDNNFDGDQLLESIYQFEEIAGTAPIPFYQLYKGFRERNIVVTLDGHGGDEIFGGYSFDLYYKLSDDFPDIFKMRKTLDTIFKTWNFPHDFTLKQTIPHFKSEFLKRIRKKKLFNSLTKEKYFSQKLFHSTFQGILPTLLRNYDKYSMQAGVEVRMPFLDHRILEFAFSLPNEYKVSKGFTKRIVRKAAAPIVPATILENRVKTGWNSPMSEWFAGPWKKWLQDQIHSIDFHNCDLIDRQDILSKVDHFYSMHPEQGGAQNLWLQLQPFLIEKANKKYSD
jgi:asparagine synthase (glutamine-hydrolysing)